MNEKKTWTCELCLWAFHGECRYRPPVMRVTFADKENFSLWSGFPTHPKTGACASFLKFDIELESIQKDLDRKAKNQKARARKAKKKGKANVKSQL